MKKSNLYVYIYCFIICSLFSNKISIKVAFTEETGFCKGYITNWLKHFYDLSCWELGWRLCGRRHLSKPEEMKSRQAAFRIQYTPGSHEKRVRGRAERTDLWRATLKDLAQNLGVRQASSIPLGRSSSGPWELRFQKVLSWKNKEQFHTCPLSHIGLENTRSNNVK